MSSNITEERPVRPTISEEDKAPLPEEKKPEDKKPEETPAWILPVAIGAGVVLVGGIAWIAMKKK